MSDRDRSAIPALDRLSELDSELVVRFWWVLLVAAGVYILWVRLVSRDDLRREMQHAR